MSSGDNPTVIRRVAVALDASPHSLEGLALAAQLAAALGAEIEGVFIEDTELLRSAALPFLREVRITTLGENALDSRRLERELRAAARRVREQLERSAAELGVTCSFRIWRGDLEADILGAALDAELFTLGRMGRFAPLRRRQKTRQTVQGSVVGILLHSSAAAARGLDAAITLTVRQASSLVIILAPNDATELPALRSQVLTRLGEQRERARVVELAPSENLGALVAAVGIDLLIVDAANPILARPSLWASLEALDCPVVIGR